MRGSFAQLRPLRLVANLGLLLATAGIFVAGLAACRTTRPTPGPPTTRPGRKPWSLARGLVSHGYREMMAGRTLVALGQFRRARPLALREKRLDLAAFADAFAGLCLAANHRPGEARKAFSRAVATAQKARAWRPLALAAEGLARQHLRAKEKALAAKRAVQAFTASLRARDPAAAGVGADLLVRAVGVKGAVNDPELNQALNQLHFTGHPGSALAEALLRAGTRLAHRLPRLAISRTRAALELARLAGDDNRIAVALANLGYQELRRGRLGLAKQILELSLERARRAGNSVSLIHAAINLGQVLKLRGELRRARKLYGQALKLSRAENRGYLTGMLLSNLSRVYAEAGDLERALVGDRQALALHRRTGPPKAIATDLNNLGSTLMDLGRTDEAIKVFGEAKRLAERMRDDDVLEAIYLNLGMLEKRRGRPEEAGRLYHAALRSLRKTGKSLYRPVVLANLGWIEVDRGRCRKAAPLLRQAIAGAAQTRNQETGWAARYGLALCAERGGRFTEARRLLAEARALAEQQRGELVGGTRAAQLFAARVHHLYRDAVDVALRLGDASGALAVAEQGRARTLLEALAGGRGATRDIPPALRRRLRAARDQVVAAERTLAHSQGTSRAQAAGVALEEARRRLEGLQEQVRKHATTLTATRPLRALQASLPTDAAIVELVPLRRRVAIFVVRHQAFSVATSARPSAEIDELVSRFRHAMERAERGQVAGRYKRALRRLYRALIAPVRARLAGVRRLYVVPSGRLNLIPFGALLDGDRPLVDDFAVAALPAASALAMVRRPLPTRPRVIAAGNPRITERRFAPLPASAREAREVAALFPGGQAWTGAAAAEARIKAVAGKADILHLATHGETNARAPMFAAVLLAPGGGEDGRLEVHEILDLDLHAGLVVLSACRTAQQVGLRGGLPAGEELVGLVAALLQAGAASVLATLWAVPDEPTALLMKTFYRELPRRGRAGALREAQRVLRRRWKHPFFWAPFVLVGDGG